MKIYDESGKEITNADLTKGEVREQTKITGTHTELLKGTEGRGADGKGLYTTVTDTETIGIYHVWTAEEIAAKNKPTVDQQITEMQAALCDVYEQLIAKG